MTGSALRGYERRRIGSGEDAVSVHVGGQGRPLLLLHGYPQTYATWSKVAPELARHFACVAADLPGYGDSAIPKDAPRHAGFSKRRMAEVLIGTMAALGFETFSVLGHDRGARVAYRMAFDHPERVEKLGIVEIIPTGDMWRHFDAAMALKAYHWTFLAQPHPLPETLIAADPIGYLEWTLKSWTRDRSLDVFTADAIASYRAQFYDPARVHAMCEDYRAGATIDRELDEVDRAAGRTIAAPLRFVWSNAGFPAQTGDPLSLWRTWAQRLSGNPIDSGHFAPEENPDAVLKSFVPFFRSG
jgi:haloacetate dehalogenase